MRRIHFFASAAAMLLLFISPLAFAQAPAVQQIEIQYAGPATVSRERILANMRTQVGQPYSQQVVEEDIRTLYATGNISNVRIFGEPTPGGVKVVVVVQTKPRVDDVEIRGATQVRAARLRRQLATKKGQMLSEATLEEDRQKILEEYRRRGFPDTTVQHGVQVDERTGNAVVVFDIAEGGRMTVDRIDFEGNQAFSDRQLRRVMKTKPANILSFITKAGRISTEQLQQDVVAIREFYQGKGYIDVQVSEPEIVPLEKGRTGITIRIEEGGQYHVGNVAIDDVQVFTPDEIRQQLKMNPGDIFSPQGLRADVKAIQDLYGARGYVDTQVDPATVSAGPGVIDIAYRIEEGTQSYIEHINISGNVRTKDKVIRRELVVAPGDVYNTVLVDRSKQRLQNLNYFSRIETYPSETLTPGRKDLNVVVEEKRTGSFNFGAGFSSIDNFIGFAEVQQSNFDITRWPNFTGGGQRFRARVQYGTRRRDFIVALTEPWFLDYQLAVGGELFYREASFVSDVYSQRNYGFELSARKPIGAFTSVRLAYRLEEIEIFDLDNNVSDIIRQEEGSRLRSSLTGSVTYDTRDSVFLTRKGERINFTAYAAGGFLGGETDIYGFDLEGSKYFLLPWDTIFLINAQLATVDTWAGGDRVPIFDRLFLGGANNLRGFKFRDVGPKDDDGEPIGGRTLARLTVEYTFPIIERVRGAVFYDVGFVNADSYDFGPDELNSDVGIGVRIDLPIGPVRLDYGFPIQSDEFNDSNGRFNFNIGYQF
jgi:outer membrane protein insertion porin family